MRQTCALAQVMNIKCGRPARSGRREASCADELRGRLKARLRCRAAVCPGERVASGRVAGGTEKKARAAEAARARYATYDAGVAEAGSAGSGAEAPSPASEPSDDVSSGSLCSSSPFW